MVTLGRIIIAVVAWIAGLVAYLAALRIGWDQSISSGDLVAVVQSSLIAWAITYAFVYVPVLQRVGRSLAPVLRFCVLPLVALPLGLVAVTLVLLCLAVPAGLLGFGWSSLSPSFFLSPEASLFYWFFAGSGVVAAIGIACLQSRQPSNQSIQRTAR
jgi:hypothetical protein